MEQTPIVDESNRENIFSTIARNGLKVVGKGASNILKAFTRYKGRPRPQRVTTNVPQQVAINNVLPHQNNLLVTPNHLLLNQNHIQQSQSLPVGRLQFWNA